MRRPARRRGHGVGRARRGAGRGARRVGAAGPARRGGGRGAARAGHGHGGGHARGRRPHVAAPPPRPGLGAAARDRRRARGPRAARPAVRLRDLGRHDGAQGARSLGGRRHAPARHAPARNAPERHDARRLRGILVTGSIAVDPAAGAAALAVLPAVGERHPGLRLVLDHLGGPVLGDRAGLARWRAALAEVARNPLVVAKLSGLYATDGPGPSYADDVREVVDVALDLFGPQRLMLGSDWPVCLLADPGRRARAAVDAALERALDGDDLAAVRSGTAARTYGLALVSR
ncbi:MAG: amidohydrolase family protein [Cellulomonas sp.]|uniref:amidohydrolase family protein n=1 Tax=Cellulomonas sp. TaxID=40001 RepID=UPI00258C9D89|nr:amidohydrolase family protein [Cellulomonas sp.]MCR6705310.1 amidohydrolase family protein [Cellulomonas sp.]